MVTDSFVLFYEADQDGIPFSFFLSLLQMHYFLFVLSAAAGDFGLVSHLLACRRRTKKWNKVREKESNTTKIYSNGTDTHIKSKAIKLL